MPYENMYLLPSCSSKIVLFFYQHNGMVIIICYLELFSHFYIILFIQWLHLYNVYLRLYLIILSLSIISVYSIQQWISLKTSRGDISLGTKVQWCRYQIYSSALWNWWEMGRKTDTSH